jgi:hypothetical protein
MWRAVPLPIPDFQKFSTFDFNYKGPTFRVEHQEICFPALVLSISGPMPVLLIENGPFVSKLSLARIIKKLLSNSF